MVLETTTLPVELYPYKNQRLPILPGGLPPSTFGVCGLNCCVRHGNRWIPAAIATELLFQDSYPDNCIKMFVLTSFILNTFLKCCHILLNAAVWSSSTSVFKTSVTRFPHPLRSSLRSKRLTKVYASLRSFKPGSLLKSSPRSISTGPLHTSLYFHFRPINHIVFVGPYLFSQ